MRAAKIRRAGQIFDSLSEAQKAVVETYANQLLSMQDAEAGVGDFVTRDRRVGPALQRRGLVERKFTAAGTRSRGFYLTEHGQWLVEGLKMDALVPTYYEPNEPYPGAWV